MATPEQANKLSNLFLDQPLSEHGKRWDGLWKEEYTPWDRAGPSMALYDVLTGRPDLVPPPIGGQRKRALVPGCGRGYDVLLLAALGYDAWGLDYSEEATKQSIIYEKKVEQGDDGTYAELKREGVEKGKVTWLTGDFFSEEWVNKAGVQQFDLIYDYTFLCALPISARPAWARRMADLLAPEGRLICLQWPTAKPWSAGGPPWGVLPEHYIAQLARPGEKVEFEADGKIPEHAMPKAVEMGGLRRLELVVPSRTHNSGIADGVLHDRIAVFAR
ncbi:hypothetical protein PspLS_03595 [Pyricularia sp. CBS 133598]|nr:hypothetical protein PspLS_03595 [Pyricularia sp. CBS 133598]